MNWHRLGQRKEKQKSQWKLIDRKEWRHRGCPQQGLSQFITTDDDGVEATISDKIPMEEALLHEYEINLTQANTTPCMVSSLKEVLGPCATVQGAHDLLLGNVQSIKGVSNATMEVLKYVALKEVTKLQTVPTPILASECQTG